MRSSDRPRLLTARFLRKMSLATRLFSESTDAEPGGINAAATDPPSGHRQVVLAGLYLLFVAVGLALATAIFLQSIGPTICTAAACQNHHWWVPVAGMLACLGMLLGWRPLAMFVGAAAGTLVIYQIVRGEICPWCIGFDASVLVAAAIAPHLPDRWIWSPGQRPVPWRRWSPVPVAVAVPFFAVLLRPPPTVAIRGDDVVLVYSSFTCAACSATHHLIDEAVANNRGVRLYRRWVTWNEAGRAAARAYLSEPTERRLNALYESPDVPPRFRRPGENDVILDAHLEEFDHSHLPGIPAVWVGGRLFYGPERMPAAARAIREAGSGSASIETSITDHDATPRQANVAIDHR